MSDITKEYSLLGLVAEVTEGTFNEPAGSDYIETLADGAKVTKTRETKERDVMSGDRLRTDLRLSSKNIELEVPVELKAGSAEGVAPKFQKMLESFGFKNRGLTSRVTSTTAHTTTIINMSAPNALKFKVNDVVQVCQAGAFHLSPVSAVGSTSITLAIPMASAPADLVQLAKSQVLVLDKTVNQTLSARRILEGGQVSEKMSGLRTSKIQLNNYSTGEYASLIFSLTGLDFEDVLEGSPLTPTTSYDNNNPPLVLEACIYKNGVKLMLNSFSLDMEQTVSIKKSLCATNGKVSSRGTGKYKVTGKIDPYKDQAAIDFKLDESEYSLFARIYNPSATAGEFAEAVAFFLPIVKSTACEVADKDGLMVDQVTFKLVPNTEADSPVIATF